MTKCLLLEAAVTGGYEHPHRETSAGWAAKLAFNSTTLIRMTSVMGTETMAT